MELDQKLFKKLMGFYQKWKTKGGDSESINAIHLPDISNRLTLIARALTGKSIDIAEAELEGGKKHHVFYLPGSFSLLPSIEENLNFYIFRVVYLCVLLEYDEELTENSIDRLSLEEARIKAAQISPSILKRIEEDYPAVAEYFHSIEHLFGNEKNPSFWIFGKLMVSEDVFENGDEKVFDESLHAKKESSPTTEIDAKPIEEVEILTVDKKAQEDYVLTHNFEKVETAEEFTGVWRGFDGDDTLEEDADALRELNLKHLVRTNEVAKSIYRAEFRDLQSIGESADSSDETFHRTYKEWDFAKKKYKLDFCKLFLKDIKTTDLSYAKKCLSENTKTLHALRRKFAQIHQLRKTVKKLPDGEGIDIDALVDWYADLKSGRTPSDNIYLSKRKKEPDLAVLFLLDLSLSTDSYADGNRVLDVEKQAVILFGEVLSEYQVDFAVGGFYSKTRNHCVYHPLKNFNETWEKGKQKIGAASPEGYTRIGPALRHSQTLIENHTATQKWVILLSDGKPNDFDKYEGKYGISDVKQALREMHEKHINTYAIAIESIARFYLPQMFGQNHYNILSHPEMLIPSLTVLYNRINNC